jgi:hypothetical protein
VQILCRVCAEFVQILCRFCAEFVQNCKKKGDIHTYIQKDMQT